MGVEILQSVELGTAQLQSSQHDSIEIVYRNYRGETALRRIVPSHIWFGGTEWHPEPQ